MFRLLTFPIRLPFKITRLVIRLTGIRTTVLLGIGIGIGLLVAPTSGAELRRRLQERMDERRTGPGSESAYPSSGPSTSTMPA